MPAFAAHKSGRGGGTQRAHSGVPAPRHAPLALRPMPSFGERGAVSGGSGRSGGGKARTAAHHSVPPLLSLTADALLGCCAQFAPCL
jgi:hypothetical protein